MRLRWFPLSLMWCAFTLIDTQKSGTQTDRQTERTDIRIAPSILWIGFLVQPNSFAQIYLVMRWYERCTKDWRRAQLSATSQLNEYLGGKAKYCGGEEESYLAKLYGKYNYFWNKKLGTGVLNINYRFIN